MYVVIVSSQNRNIVTTDAGIVKVKPHPESLIFKQLATRNSNCYSRHVESTGILFLQVRTGIRRYAYMCADNGRHAKIHAHMRRCAYICLL